MTAPGLFDGPPEALHARQLLEPGLQRREALEVLLPQQHLHALPVTALLEQTQALANPLAHLPRFTEHRDRQALAEQEYRQKHHAEKDQQKVAG